MGCNEHRDLTRHHFKQTLCHLPFVPQAIDFIDIREHPPQTWGGCV